MPVTSAVINREDLQTTIEQAGSGHPTFFGFPEREDGLYLQQDPEEFAHFVEYAATRLPASKLSLDIGIASGGQTKFLRDYFSSEKTIVVDIGQHPAFIHWSRIKPKVNSDIVLEIIDDSHARAVADKLSPYAGQIDFAYVDGDHSYRGLKKDIFLVRSLLQPGGHMVLHDTLAVPDCRRVYEELLASQRWHHIRTFNFRFGISIWRLKGPKAQKPKNWRFGWGSL
jgi:hypothetical protein